MEKLDKTDLIVICWGTDSLKRYTHSHIDKERSRVEVPSGIFYTLGDSQFDLLINFRYTPGRKILLSEEIAREGGSVYESYICSVKEEGLDHG